MSDYLATLRAKYPELQDNVDYELHYWSGGPNPAKGGADEAAHYYLIWKNPEDSVCFL